MTEHLLIGLALIAVLGIGAQWVAWRFKVPSILLLLLFGFAAGNLTDVVDPDHLLGDLLFPVVSLSVAIILFEGGLSLRYAEFREVGRTVFSLVSVGALVTWVVGSAAAWAILDFDLSLAILLGAILVVTGPTVIVPLLQHVRPTRPVGPILKWEGIVIDPIGAMLTVLIFEAILAGRFATGLTVALTGVVKTVVFGGLFGVLAAAALTFLLRRYLVPDYLQNPVAIMFVVAAFAASNHFQDESGLFAAPLMGLILANRKRLTVRHIIEFQENVRVLLLAGLFILLGARVTVDDLRALGWRSFLFLAVLILVVRPAAVAASTLRSSLSWQQRTYLASIAPRGVVAAAIASLYAIRLTAAGRPAGAQLVPETFLVIVGTVAIYGLAAKPLANVLGVSKKQRGIVIVGAYVWAREIAKALQREGQEVLLLDSNHDNVAAARMEGLTAHEVDVLSEHALDEFDTEGIGRVLAMTSNDDFNSLLALHFLEMFERSEVYQLASERQPDAADREMEGPMASHLHGRILFGPNMTFTNLTVRFAAGAEIKATPLTRQFDMDAYRERYGRSAVPLFLVTEQGDVEVFTADHRPVPRPGQTLIGLVEPQRVQEAEPRSPAGREGA